MSRGWGPPCSPGNVQNYALLVKVPLEDTQVQRDLDRPVTDALSSPVPLTHMLDAFCFVLALKKVNEAGIKSSM